MQQTQSNPKKSISSKKGSSILKEIPENSAFNKIHLKFKFKSFGLISLNFALNNCMYGTQCMIYQMKTGKITLLGRFECYIDPENLDKLIILPIKVRSPENQVQYLTQILSIYNLSSYIFPIPDELSKLRIDCLLNISVNLPVNEYFVLFDSQQIRDAFHQGLQHLIIEKIYSLQFSNQIAFFDHQLMNVIDESMKDQLFEVSNVQQILKKLEFRVSEDYVKIIFFNGTMKEITLQQIKNKIPLLLRRTEIQHIFEEYCSGFHKVSDPNIGSMTLDEFKRFLQEQQHVFLEEQQFNSLANHLMDSSGFGRSYNLISFNSFAKYLTHSQNQILNWENAENSDQMNNPLNLYFISASRQTLQFDESYSTFECLQKYSGFEEGVLPLLFAFERGARYIELNVWDGPEDIPICFYGAMMNFQIKLERIFETIREFAFIYSEFPLIVSIDNHCQSENKSKIAMIAVKVLGDMLEYYNENLVELPSPQSLKFKVLMCDRIILNMSTDSSEDSDDMGWQVDDGEMFYESQLKLNMKQFQERNQLMESVKLKVLSQIDNSHLIENVLLNDFDEKIMEINNELISPVLKEVKTQITTRKLIEEKHYFLQEAVQQHFGGIKMNNFIYPIKDWVKRDGISSNKVEAFKQKSKLVEKDTMKKHFNSSNINAGQADQISFEQIHSKKSIPELFYEIEKQHEKGAIFKFVPNAKMTDTANTYASQGFLCGFQIIMIHHHIIDYDYMYYYAQFQRNGGVNCGYVLKQHIEKQKQIRDSMNFNLISGYQLNNPKFTEGISPFVQVLLRTPQLGKEDKVQQFSSKIIKNNSFNPVFNLNCSFQIENLALCVLMVCIYSQNSENLIGWNAFTLDSIRQGYRVILIKDEFLNEIPGASLFCQIQFKNQI